MPEPTVPQLWVVWYNTGTYNLGEWIEGVFSSRELAEQYIAEKEPKPSDRWMYDIVSCILDDPKKTVEIT